MNIGIIGCGDFLRVEEAALRASRKVTPRLLFDTDPARAKRWAEKLGCGTARDAGEIIDSRDIDIVGVFVPPFARKDLVVRAARAGKHIVTTKPLAPTVEECMAMVDAVEKSGKACSVQYKRSGDGLSETLKDVFESGEIGSLALYKQDSVHHYPQWNTWALDPVKNGGPFMDAVIHNLTLARYLMGRPATAATMFSDNHAQSLTCNDTEFLKLDFQRTGSAHLFVTWAADLAIHGTEGNFRDVFEWRVMITDQRWFVAEGKGEEAGFVVATRLDEKKRWPVRKASESTYDTLATAAEKGQPLPRSAVTIRQAAEDIRIIRQALAFQGQRTPLSV
jgi:predicted dehydrogenase